MATSSNLHFAWTKLRKPGRWMGGGIACALLCVIGVMMPRAAVAQAVYGSIFGTVTDKTGAAIPGAKVMVTDISKGTSVSVASNASGNYRVDHLIPDAYSVTVKMKGFQTTTVPSVTVNADSSPKVDVSLPVGSASQTVTVNGGTPLLQTASTDVSTVLNSRTMEQTPNLDRNLTAFELLTPGTSYLGWSVSQATNPQQSEQIEVNGQLPFATGYQLDGTDNEDPVNGVEVINPNLDAVAETKIVSQNYDAEFGNAIGGVVTVQTKSGTNHFHGSVFDYRRSSAQFARDPFTQPAGTPLPSFLHNQFGGSIGGPIKRNKLFFFGDYQGLRERTGTTIITTVPTALAHTSCTSGGNCNLSDYLNPTLGGSAALQAYDPGTDQNNPVAPANRTPFANNIIPAGRISAPAINLIKDLPMPNYGNGSIINNYVGNGAGGFNTDQWDVRVDDELSQNFHAFARYTRFDSNLNGQPVFGAAGGPGLGVGNFAGTDTTLDQSLAAGGALSLSSHWLTDFRFGWYRLHLQELGPDANTAAGTALGIPGVNQAPLSINGGLPQFNIQIPANGANEGNNVSYGTQTDATNQLENVYQISNNWTRTLGNHTITFGGLYEYATLFNPSVQNGYLFSGNFTFNYNTTQGPGGAAGLGYASFLLGDSYSFTRTVLQNTSAASHQPRLFWFAQDQWRATRNLTISYGLRWDMVYPEAVDGKGQGGLLDFNTGAVRVAGYGGFNNALNVKMKYTHLAPRVGIAWQVLPHTVVRAGYGREYGMGWSGNTFGDVLTYSYPVAVEQNNNAAQSYGWALNLTNGPSAVNFPAIPANGLYPLPNNIQESSRPLTMRVPTLDAWNLTVQQQLTRSSSLQIAYVGSHGIHNQFDSSNQANNNTQTLAGFNCYAQGTCSLAQVPKDPVTGQPYTLNERLPYYDGTAQKYLGVGYGSAFGWTQQFRYNANEATTSYNALQVVFNKHFSNSFQFMANYTWSKARAHESEYFFINPAEDYGNSYYNRPQQFLANGNWDLPFGHGHRIGAHVPGWVNQIIGGFSINGVLTAEDGLPFTPTYAECGQDEDIDTGGTLCRPNAIGPHVNYGLGKQGFNPVAHNERYFTPVAPLTVNGQANGIYVRPAPGTFGQIERNSLYGPGYFDTDASVAKNFFLAKAYKLQLTAQFYNLFNHPNLNEPSNCIDCSTGGLVTDVVPNQVGTSMRAVQFAARLQF